MFQYGDRVWLLERFSSGDYIVPGIVIGVRTVPAFDIPDEMEGRGLVSMLDVSNRIIEEDVLRYDIAYMSRKSGWSFDELLKGDRLFKSKHDLIEAFEVAGKPLLLEKSKDESDG
jgi:hypothetical protein